MCLKKMYVHRFSSCFFFSKYIECFHSPYHGLNWSRMVAEKDECDGKRCKNRKEHPITSQFLRNPDKLIRRWTSWTECTSAGQKKVKHRYKTEKQTIRGQCTPNCPQKDPKTGDHCTNLNETCKYGGFCCCTGCGYT